MHAAGGGGGSWGPTHDDVTSPQAGSMCGGLEGDAGDQDAGRDAGEAGVARVQLGGGRRSQLQQLHAHMRPPHPALHLQLHPPPDSGLDPQIQV